MSHAQTCPNCGAVLTCGCQRRTASDGVQACSNCVQSYEMQKNSRKLKTPKLNDRNDPFIYTYYTNPQ